MNLSELVGQTIEFQPDGFIEDDRLQGVVLRFNFDTDSVLVQTENDGQWIVKEHQITGTGFD